MKWYGTKHGFVIINIGYECMYGLIIPIRKSNGDLNFATNSYV